MSLLKEILNTDNGKAVDEISKQFGLSKDQTTNAITHLVPAFQRSMQHKESSGELYDLLDLMEEQEQYNALHEPKRAMTKEGVNKGNNILGHLFGSKDVSRAVASSFSAKTGLTVLVLKKLLPVIANLVLSAIVKSKIKKGSKSKGLLGLLDFDGDGSGLDDILKIAGKILK